MQLCILVISENNWLEILLKQYFKDINVITNNSIKDADIIINQSNQEHVNIEIVDPRKSWSISKPLSIIKLISIIELAIQILSQNIIQIGQITFYPAQKICKINNEEIILTAKETEILLYLAQHPKQEIDKNTLLHEIWGYNEDISTHTLETHIYKLRSKFSGKNNLIISNDSGYSLAF